MKYSDISVSMPFFGTKIVIFCEFIGFFVFFLKIMLIFAGKSRLKDNEKTECCSARVVGLHDN